MATLKWERRAETRRLVAALNVMHLVPNTTPTAGKGGPASFLT